VKVVEDLYKSWLRAEVSRRAKLETNAKGVLGRRRRKFKVDAEVGNRVWGRCSVLMEGEKMEVRDSFQGEEK